jgi:MFS family permease
MKRGVLYLIALTVFLGMFGWNLGEKFLSFVLAETTTQASQVSIVFFTIYGMLAFSNFFTSRLIESRGSRLAMAAGILLYSPLLFAVAFSRSFALFLVFAALLGFGGSLFWLGVQSTVAKTFEKKGEAMGLIQGTAIFGTAFSAICGGVLLFFLGDANNLFLIGGVLVVLAGLIALSLPASKTVKKPVISWRKQLGFFKDKNLLMLGFISMVCSSFVGVAFPMVPMIIKGIPPALPYGKGVELALVLFVLHAVAAASTFLAGKVCDLKGRSVVFYGILLAGTASSIIIFSSNSLWLLALGVMVYAPFLWLVRVPVTAAVGDLFKENQAFALAVTSFSESMGVALGALISAVVVLVPGQEALVSFKLPFLVIGVLFLACTVFVRKLPIK